MIKLNDKKYCTGCGACANICPKHIITMKHDEEGFAYPQIEIDQCINCDQCEKICPVVKHEKHSIEECYAAVNVNTDIRIVSSSGGIFSAFADMIIKNNGVVYGVKMSNDCKHSCHVRVSNEEGIRELRGSKYLQSEIGSTYKQCKSDLENGLNVLFSGTPCQIAGLKNYLKKDYDTLFTQDFICHGVPSPLVWEKYVEMREKKAASPVKKIFFRHKNYGWKMFSVLFEFSNSTKYIKDLYHDEYMKGFLNNLYLRPSCYECQFKGMKRVADVSLADFWGIEDFLPEMNDDKGTSLVMINTLKGKEYWKKIQDYLNVINVSSKTNEILQYNSAALESAKMNPDRDNFFDMLKNESIEKVFNKYCKISTMSRIKAKIRYIIKGKK